LIARSSKLLPTLIENRVGYELLRVLFTNFSDYRVTYNLFAIWLFSLIFNYSRAAWKLTRLCTSAQFSFDSEQFTAFWTNNDECQREQGCTYTRVYVVYPSADFRFLAYTQRRHLGGTDYGKCPPLRNFKKSAIHCPMIKC
jgi:hypothetical protein